MQVGVLQFFYLPRQRISIETVYERAFDRIRIMERSGYDCVWLGEHHFNTYSVCPSVHLMGMYVAAMTERLRIGMGVTIATMYHPLRIAEEVALLDVLSGGRVNWGAGRGFDPAEFKAFAVPPDDSPSRFQEHVTIVLEAWRNQHITFDGNYWHFDDVEVLPKPKQQPHPPFWAATGSDDGIRWAASQGHSIMLGPHGSHQEIARNLALYRDALREHEHPVEGRTLPIARRLAIAETDAEAEEIARAGAEWEGYALPPGDGDPVERYINDAVIYGSPDRVVDELERLREEIDLQYLLCLPMSHDTFVRFTEHVLPRVGR